MTAVKERIMGVIEMMDDTTALEVWRFIRDGYVAKKKTWDDIEEAPPDEYDLELLARIENDPEYSMFVAEEDVKYE
jgi:hypothetical protein